MKDLKKIARKFSVCVIKPCDDDPPGSVYLSFTGESVRGVYFFPRDNSIRLRIPDYTWVKGDWASAIAIAIVRHYGFDYENCELTKTIRSFKS